MLTADTHVRMSGSQEDCDCTGEPERPVDLVHLSRQTMGNKDLENEVLRLYAQQAAICVEQLAEADSPRAWLEAAHALKGSARGIGAWKVAEAAELAEKWTFVATGDEGRKHRCDVAEAVGNANRFIEKILADG